MLPQVKRLLKTIIVFGTLYLTVPVCMAQVLSFDNLLTTAALPQPKFDVYIFKKGFLQTGKSQHADTLVNQYTCRKVITKKGKPVDTIMRLLSRAVCKDFFSVKYITTSPAECAALKEKMKAAKFYCNEEADSLTAPSLLYQNYDVTISTSTAMVDSITTYTFLFYQKIFPKPADIFYADDLLTFTSHEYLVYFFGENNVKKDIYFLSGNEMAKCSVLFSNTQRQVVFIWQDEVNRSGIANLLFGGQQRLKSTMENNNFIGESNWLFKSGIRAGMTLYELRNLNGNDFKFYGGNSVNSGSIIPDNGGKLDFKKEDIILGCINCKDGKFSSTSILNADDALADGRIVFVLSVILNPPNNPVAAKLE